MLKTVVMVDGKIINVGDWDYKNIDIKQYDKEGNEIGLKQIPTNPLPDGAIIEQREMTYSVETGWMLADRPAISNEDVLKAKIEAHTINLLIELGVI